MNDFLLKVRRAVVPPTRWTIAVLTHPSQRFLAVLAILCFVAFVDYVGSWRTGRAFAYYSALDGRTRVEHRYLTRMLGREKAVSQYVSELLLGPADVESLPLFSKGASVKSVMVRKGIAYIDLSKEAAIPASDRRDLRRELALASSDVERNFPTLKHAIFYIEGHEPYASDVRSKTPGTGIPKNGKSVDK